jgi:hypothetical protein
VAGCGACVCAMPKRHCAYISCPKRSDQPSFGCIHKLTDEQRSSYSAWLKQQHDGAVRNGQYTALRSPTCCRGVQGCPLLPFSSHSDHRSVPCMDCMQMVLVRCPRSTMSLAGWGVSAANAADGARQLSRRREVRVYSQDAGAMRCGGRCD